MREPSGRRFRPRPLDPRLRGDDAVVSNRATATPCALGRPRHLIALTLLRIAVASISFAYACFTGSASSSSLARSVNTQVLSLPSFSSLASRPESAPDSRSRPTLPASLPALRIAACRSGGSLRKRLAGEAYGPDGDRVLRQRDVRPDFVELHRIQSRGLVLRALDHAGLDRVVDLVVGDHRRLGADRSEHLGLDRRAHDAHREAAKLRHVAYRLVGDQIARAAAGVADDHHVRLFRNVVDDRLEGVGIEHLVPVIEIAEQERHVEQRRGLGERRHVRWRHDAVVDRDALAHVGEIILLQPQLAVAVEHEIDRLAVVLLDQLLELQQRLVERVRIVELDGAVQRDRLLCKGIERQREAQYGHAARERADEY